MTERSKMLNYYKNARKIWNRLFELETKAYCSGTHEEIMELIFEIRQDAFSIMTEALIEMPIEDLQELKSERESNAEGDGRDNIQSNL